MSSTKAAGSSLAIDLLQEGDLRVDRGDDHRSAELLAALEDHAGHATALGEDLRDAGVRADLGAEAASAGRDRVADRAHAAFRHGPRAEVAVADVTDRMVRHHVAGARLVRAGPGADQAVERHHGLHLVGLEEAVEDVDDAHRHQPGDVPDRLHVEPAEPPRQPQLLVEVRGLLRSHGGRDRHQHRAEHVGEAADPGVPALDRVGVLLGELRERLVVLLRIVVVLDDAAAVGERQEVRADGVGLVPVVGELEVPLDRVGHQAHDVAERGDLELGSLRPGRHGVGGAAHLVPWLPGRRSSRPTWRGRRRRRGRCGRRRSRSRGTCWCRWCWRNGGAGHDGVPPVWAPGGTRPNRDASPERPFKASQET